MIVRAVLLFNLLLIVNSQFVFFGRNHGPPRSLTPKAPPPSPPQQRQERLLVQPPTPPETAIDDRFAPTFFRPLKKLSQPKKTTSELSNEMGPVKFVQILSDPDLILTEEGGVRKSKMPEASPEREGRLLVDNANSDVVVPDLVMSNVVSTTTTTKTPPPTTTTITTTTTKAPVTTKPVMRIVSSFQSSPIVRGSSRNTATITRGSPTITQLSPSRPSQSSSSSRIPKAFRTQPAVKGNYQYKGKDYLLTWRMGRNNFDWKGGVDFCASIGMELISLDTKEKSDHFISLVRTDRAPYFWSGGQISNDIRTLTWLNGKSEPIARGQHPWSYTGRRGPQPDGGERCLAILNNTYRDGVKYHDVACHHRKPVICEQKKQ